MEVKILMDSTRKENYNLSCENAIKIQDRTVIKFFPATHKNE